MLQLFLAAMDRDVVLDQLLLLLPAMPSSPYLWLLYAGFEGVRDHGVECASFPIPFSSREHFSYFHPSPCSCSPGPVASPAPAAATDGGRCCFKLTAVAPTSSRE
ncbi:hypothetical protein LR48_Vigan09g051900 [Vigna angularis]|uniref:Uncharacterized protein n=1 Tax=Phaseolus angularis TaxID=3914 RepID=A0A0L9V9T7_PHAAN|nr:hypothetical protein LR48_Vigan02g016600 [Vigna angularis]KOM51860.1 hypothetical protein LR48_Vigan09g051900 [Vigna angularis]